MHMLMHMLMHMHMHMHMHMRMHAPAHVRRRMLHGRTAIVPPTAGSGSRWLRGCYVNIDEFANRYNQVRARHASGAEPGMHHLGNQDWAEKPCTLPAEAEGAPPPW